MGLPDFVKENGKKLFSRDTEAAETIMKHIEESNPGITGLHVKYDNGVVSLSGQAANSEALEKAVLMGGNIMRVLEVKVHGLQAPTMQAKV